MRSCARDARRTTAEILCSGSCGPACWYRCVSSRSRRRRAAVAAATTASAPATRPTTTGSRVPARRHAAARPDPGARVAQQLPRPARTRRCSPRSTSRRPRLARTLDYAHAPLPKQFDIGVRQIELDVWSDPHGRQVRASRRSRSQQGVQHPGQPGDERARASRSSTRPTSTRTRRASPSCCASASCSTWSDAHPGHVPIDVHIEMKDDKATEPMFAGARARDPARCSTARRSSRPTTCAAMRRRWAQRSARTAGRRSAPCAARSTSRSTTKGFRAAYLVGHPSLRGRLIFTPSAPGQDDAAFAKLNDPVADAAKIKAALAAHMIVRTRADADTVRGPRERPPRRAGRAERWRAAREHRLRAARPEARQRLRDQDPGRYAGALRSGHGPAGLQADRRRGSGEARRSKLPEPVAGLDDLADAPRGTRPRTRRRARGGRTRSRDDRPARCASRPSSSATTCLETPSVARIPTWGRLMTGNEIHVPDAPGLVIVNVPPARSSGASFRARARAGDLADRRGEGAQAQAVGVVHHRHDETLEVEVDRDPEVHGAVRHDRQPVLGRRRVHQRELAQRVDHRAGDERQRGEPGAGASVVDRARSRPRRPPARAASVRFDASSADRGPAPDVVERHDLVAPVRPRPMRPAATATHVGARDAAARPPARQRRRIDAELAREIPHRGRHEAACVARRASAPRQGRRLAHVGLAGCVTATQATSYTAGQCTTPHSTDRSTHTSTRRSTTSASRSCRASATTARSRCASRTVPSSRSRARATRRCCSASPARLRAGYDWFFPYYRDRALALALGVTPLEMLLQAVGAAADPASGGRQMPCHWGAARLNIVSQTSVHRRASACPRSAARKRRATSAGARTCPAAPRTATSSRTCRSARARPPKASSGSRSTPRARLHLPVLFVVADNGYAISVRSTDQASRADLGDGARHPRAARREDGRPRLLRGAPQGRRTRSRTCAPARARASSTRSSPARTRTRSPTTRRSTAAPRSSTTKREHDPIAVLEQRAGRARRAHAPRPSTQMRAEAKRDGARRGRGRARAAAARARVASSTTSSAPPPVTDDAGRAAPPTPTPTSSRSARRSGSRCTSRWRSTNASACSARTSPTPTRTSSTKCPARAACSASRSASSARSATPAASTRRSRRRTSSAAPSGRRCADCGRARRSSSSTTCGRR